MVHTESAETRLRRSGGLEVSHLHISHSISASGSAVWEVEIEGYEEAWTNAKQRPVECR